MSKHFDQSTIIDILDVVKRYKSYGITEKNSCTMIELPFSTFYSLKKRICHGINRQEIKRIIPNPYKITQEEKEKIVDYAKKNPQYFHRELTYRMIDNGIVSVGESTVYRILKENDLIGKYKKKKYYGWNHLYSNEASAPDELYQADITYLKYNGKDVYQLSFIDVYSRYVVFSSTLTNMTSSTVSDVLSLFIEKNKDFLHRVPRLQTDNGSCFISYEFQKVIEKYKLTHTTIHPGTPTENVIIERWHRTFKEILSELKEPDSFEDLIKITEEAIYYYNYLRYHKSLDYVTPYEYYRGNPGLIFIERERKIKEARENRKKMNIGVMENYLF